VAKFPKNFKLSTVVASQRKRTVPAFVLTSVALPLLIDIDLSYCNVGDQIVMQLLSQSPDVRAINLCSTDISVGALSKLHALSPQLRYILRKISLIIRYINVAQCSQLKSVAITHNQLLSLSISKCFNLEQITLEASKLQILSIHVLSFYSY
jgi:hypothetical protein